MYDCTTGYGVDRRGEGVSPRPSHSSFGCDSPFVPDEAGRQIAAKRVVVLGQQKQEQGEARQQQGSQ